MTDINKQKFLAELGKLLTFMYEEDRQTALAMYNRMFDEAEDEQTLMQLLVSPTRQAVVVARAYNAKERKLQVHAQSRDDDGLAASQEDTPDFVLAIAQIHESIIPQNITAPEVPADQISLFEDSGSVPASANEADAPAENDISVQAQEPDTAAEIPPEEDAIAPDAETPEATVEVENSVEETAAPDSTESAAAEVEPEAAPETLQPENDESVPSDAVDNFIANFSIEDNEFSQIPAAADEPDLPTVPEGRLDVQDEPEFLDDDHAPVLDTIRKPRIFLLILYIILAVPVTLAGVVLLLVPTLLFLILAVAVIGLGSVTLIASFSGFAVFADILVMLGAALIILALGLLFLWIFIWFIGGAIVGLIRSVLSLGSRWCYKEVPAV